MKVYINNANENWICDRFYSEWKEYNPETISFDPFEADVVWLLASWKWDTLPLHQLKDKIIVATIHHIVPDKFDNQKKTDFMNRDQFIDYYHVPCNNTYNQIKELTRKPVFVNPFWVNQNIWKKARNKNKLRTKYGFSKNDFLVGSFQRDTEGHDLKSPKLEKGPDRFVKIVQNLNDIKDNLVVIISGPRRNYVIEQLEKNGVKYIYYENSTFEKVNDLYNLLDLYIVSSRYEGGPQSIVECALTKTPIISTKVGLAPDILDNSSLYDDENNFSVAEPNVKAAYNNVQDLIIPQGFNNYLTFFKGITMRKEK